MPINVVTEDEFPIQYLKNGKLAGPASNAVKAILRESGYEYEIRVLPWSRAYKEALTFPNTLIFSMVRTEQREALFHWVGEIQHINYALIRLKERTDLQIESLNSLGTHRIGVIRDSGLHIYFKNLGLDSNLIVSSSEEISYKVLLKQRVEFIPRNVPIMALDCINLQLDCTQFEPAYALKDLTKGVYIAMSKNSDEQVVSKIKGSFDQLQKAGVIHDLMKDTYNAEKLKNSSAEKKARSL